ncbi:N-acetylglucosamine kinase [Cohnella sp. JJ-181]|uniref:N-acetylglucosamine kinase n=1 Tax=Cohnella rhizoplanae TaxID=2974897 RepID=UPI0022FF7C34|nr:BadF/BadG/BcrA/BcrD ATPase family protein [Cohnella sp. JJ-181]CAI6069709.1 N-acetylmuramic acid/N-acetylglucosamine kinase [Cohnella sp. JJ-181]
MKYYLGVDGGGSKTLALVCNERGEIVGRGYGGCGNHQLGPEPAKANIRAAVDEALARANVSRGEVAYAVYGLAGADREADFRVLRPMMADLGLDAHDIVCDTVIGLRAGTRQPDGVVLVCGSGTNCYGVNKRGESFQCGGFGYEYGDFGGGGELAVEAFRTAIRAWEGRSEPTLLAEAVPAALGFPSVEAMFHDFLDRDARIPRDLVKLLFEVADRDESARAILRRQGVELGLSAQATIRRLGMEADRFDVVLVGSVLTRGDSRYVVPYIEDAARAIAPRCSLRVLTIEPAGGALLLAMDRSGLEIPPEVYDNLTEALPVQAAAVQGGSD